MRKLGVFTPLACAATLSLLPSCGDDSGRGDSGDESSSPDSDNPFDTEGISGDGDSTSTTFGDSGFDPDTAGTDSDSGGMNNLCQFIDFVFVVDNSRSMADEQEALVQAVPSFVESMKTALPSVRNFRVGVVDTDAYPGLGTVDNPLDSCGAAGADCDSCDYQTGAFLTKPASAMDPATSCDFSTGVSYMDGDAETFPAEFECAALVGTEGNGTEQQVGALVEAISDEKNGAGACNEGFLRDEALLVFLIISDEEDDNGVAPGPPYGGSIGDPDRWYAAVVDAKNGKASNVVALGLVGGAPRYDDCTDLMANNEGAEEAPRLQQFLDKFDASFSGSVCSQSYSEFFNDALMAVEEGCIRFIP